jgi:hypothetical protein
MLREHRCYKNRVIHVLFVTESVNLLQSGCHFRKRSNWYKGGVMFYFLQGSLGPFVIMKPIYHFVLFSINNGHQMSRPDLN